jgi:hypothetical protein
MRPASTVAVTGEAFTGEEKLTTIITDSSTAAAKLNAAFLLICQSTQNPFLQPAMAKIATSGREKESY